MSCTIVIQTIYISTVKHYEIFYLKFLITHSEFGCIVIDLNTPFSIISFSQIIFCDFQFEHKMMILCLSQIQLTLQTW